jgi:hypothetical protein
MTTAVKHGNITAYQNGCRCDDCREANTVYAREWRAKTGYSHHSANLKKTFGLPYGWYDEKFEEQLGRCAICLEPRPNGQKLHVDHDHETGQVRDLLCPRCNMLVGLVEGSADLYESIIAYIERHAT